MLSHTTLRAIAVQPVPPPPCDHVWSEEYYGWECTKCGLFIDYGSAPWCALPEEAFMDEIEDEVDA